MNLNFVDLRLSASNEIVSIDDLAIDPNMQMRVQMDMKNLENIVDKITDVLDEHPIHVVEVETPSGRTIWYVVDGFHRYHAAREAGLSEVSIVHMKGSYEEAVQYSMASNWNHGKQPSSADAERAISILLENAPDFGYKSSNVTKWLKGLGVTKTAAAEHTKELREQIDTKRDTEILRLSDEGKTQREISNLIGCSQMTVSNVIKQSEQNDQSGQNVQQVSQEDDTAPFFSDDELDETPALNPADAFNQALKENEAEREEKSASYSTLNSETEDETGQVRPDALKTETDSNIIPFPSADATTEEKVGGVINLLATLIKQEPRACFEYLSSVPEDDAMNLAVIAEWLGKSAFESPPPR